MSIKRYKIAILPIIFYSILQVGNIQSVYATQFELGDFKFYESNKAPLKNSLEDTNIPESEKIYITTDTEPNGIQISKTNIDFGEISPGEPFLRSLSVSIPPSHNGTFLYISEDSTPSKENNIQFPNTRCDDGNCSELIASSWLSPLTYGFGYRCDNGQESSGCLLDFSDKTHYRQFADESSQKSPQVAIKTNTSADESAFNITYKINSAPSQEPGGYKNTTTLITLPRL